jgi:hypothetical protein
MRLGKGRFEGCVMSALARKGGPSFADRLIGLMARVDCHPVVAAAELDEVFRLRYDAYLREDAIEATAHQRLTDRYEGLPNAHTFAIRIDGRLASSIRIHVASQSCPTSPAVEWYDDVLMPEIEAGKVIIDPNRFVADAEAARAIPELPYVTVRLGFVAALHFNADIVTATVRGEHMAFYRRVFGLAIDCPPRINPPLTVPFGLMTIREFSTREQVMNRYPCFQSTPEERQRLFARDTAAPPLSPAMGNMLPPIGPPALLAARADGRHIGRHN